MDVVGAKKSADNMKINNTDVDLPKESSSGVATICFDILAHGVNARANPDWNLYQSAL